MVGLGIPRSTKKFGSVHCKECSHGYFVQADVATTTDANKTAAKECVDNGWQRVGHTYFCPEHGPKEGEGPKIELWYISRKRPGAQPLLSETVMFNKFAYPSEIKAVKAAINWLDEKAGLLDKRTIKKIDKGLYKVNYKNGDEEKFVIRSAIEHDEGLIL